MAQTATSRTCMDSIMKRMLLPLKLVSKATGINPGRISQIKNGKSMPSPREKEILEYYFDQPINLLTEQLED